MRSPSFFRSISSKLSTTKWSGPSSAVAPMPEQSRFSEEVTAKLDGLRSLESCDYGSSSWLVGVLDATIATQIAAQESICADKLVLSDMGKEMIEDYLESNVELLDACNGLVEKMSMIQKYVDSVKMAIRLLDCSVGYNVVTYTRTQEIFKKCSKLEEQCATLDKCSPKLCKLMGQKAVQVSHGNDLELHEALSGSKEVASMGCHLLQRALSFKSRQGLMKMKSKLPTTWSSSLNELQSITNEEAERRKKCAPWMMKELEQMVVSSKMLHDQVKSQKGDVDIDSLKRSCEALQQGLEPLEERVRELYRHLISVRMALLDILSQN